MSAHQLFIHLAWTTLDRKPMIDAATRSFLEEFFKKTAARQDVEIVEVAMLKTHVHMVIRTPPRIDLPRLVQFFKGGPRQLDTVRQYLRNKPNHHADEAI